MLHLGHAVHGIIVGLADDRPVNAQLVAEAADLGHAPGAVVRDAEIADLARLHEIAHRPHRLGQRHGMVLLVEVVDVDVVGAEPSQAGIGRLHHPFAERPRSFGPGPMGLHTLVATTHLSRSPAMRAARDLLRPALVVDIGGVEEIHAGLPGPRDDAVGGGLVGRTAEHHGAQAQLRDLQAASAQCPVVHGPVIHRSLPQSVAAGPAMSRIVPCRRASG